MAGTLSDIARWTGAVSGNLSTAGNYTAVAGTPSLPPAAGEQLWIVPVPGTTPGAITATLNHYAAVKLGAVVMSNFHAGIGGPGTPVEFDETSIRINDCANVNIGGGGTDGNSVHILSTAGTGVVLANGRTNLLYAQSGNVSVAAACRVDTIHNAGAAIDIPDPHASNQITTLVQTKGAVRTGRTFTTANISGTSSGSTATMIRDAAGTTLNVYGGTVFKRSTGTITTLNGYAGRITPEGSPFPSSSITNSLILAGTFQFIDKWGTSTLTLGGGTHTTEGFDPLRPAI